MCWLERVSALAAGVVVYVVHPDVCGTDNVGVEHVANHYALFQNRRGVADGVLVEPAVGLVDADVLGEYHGVEINVNARCAHLARLQLLEAVREYVHVVLGAQVLEQLNGAGYKVTFGGYAPKCLAAEGVGQLLVVDADNLKRVAVASAVQLLLRYLALAIYAPQLEVVGGVY